SRQTTRSSSYRTFARNVPWTIPQRTHSDRSDLLRYVVGRPGASTPNTGLRRNPIAHRRRCTCSQRQGDPEEHETSGAEQERAEPDALAPRQGSDGPERDRHLKDRHGVCEAVMCVEQVVGFDQLLVPLTLPPPTRGEYTTLVPVEPR